MVDKVAFDSSARSRAVLRGQKTLQDDILKSGVVVRKGDVCRLLGGVSRFHRKPSVRAQVRILHQMAAN